jgi:hypothetical protein
VPNSGAATGETCNNLDDNCDGTVDNNASFADGYESNDSCGAYKTLATVGSDQTLNENALKLYPSGDVDYFRINATESDEICGCGFTDEDYDLTITLSVPTGAGSYSFCAAADCANVGTFCQEVVPGESESWTFQLDGACGVGNDSYTVYVRITGQDAPGFECAPYTLSYFFDAGLCR